MRDAIFMRRENHYHLVKGGKSFIINAHKGKSKISLVSAHKAMLLINASKKYVLLFLRQPKRYQISGSEGILGRMYKREKL
jgi:hypothetical protein